MKLPVCVNFMSTRRRPRSASKCHRRRKRWGMFSFLFRTSQRGIKTSRPVITPPPPPSSHTHIHTRTPSEKKKMRFSYTIRTTKKYDYSFWQIIQSSTPWYFTTSATSAADKFIYIYILIYTSFLYLGKTIRHITKNMILRVDFLHDRKETNAKNETPRRVFLWKCSH